LRGHVQRHRAEIDPNHLVDDRDQEEKAGTLRRREKSAKPEDDTALVLPGDTDRGREDEDDDRDDGGDGDEPGGHGIILR
jgi:hypothetical protein